MAEKLDIRLLMAAIDERIFEAYSEFTEEERKAIAPLVIMRWAACYRFSNKDSGDRLIKVNERVNKHLWTLSKHKNLTWQLLASCGNGKYQDHSYVGVNKTKDKTTQWLCSLYPTTKLADIEVMRNLMTNKELKQLAKDHGLDDKQIRDLKI